jgi:hypothetical protein
MSQRPLMLWMIGAAMLMAACGSTSVQSATSSPAALEGDGSTVRGTSAEPSPASSRVATPGDGASTPPRGPSSAAGCTSNPAPVFPHHCTDLDQIDFINPTIVTSSNWLHHKVVMDAQNNAPAVTLYPTADAVATGVTYYLGRMMSWEGEAFGLGQYEVRFQVSCEVTFGFDHISHLAEPFASLAPVEPSRTTRDAEVPVSVEVEAGQLIGWTSGTEPAHTWDFIVSNSSAPNEFANHARYEVEGDLVTLLHASYPYDHLEPELADAYRAKFRNWEGRAANAACGFSPDVPRSLAGEWFLSPYGVNARMALSE